MRVAAVLAIALGVAVFGAGCGGSDDSTIQQQQQASPDPQRIEKAEARAEREARELRKLESEVRADANARAAGSPKKTPPTTHESESTPKFTGAQAKRYQEDKELCGLFPPSKVARDLGLPAGSDPITIAEAYADGYQPQFHQAAFEGCLAGLG
jgi:hypothetical protein